MNKLFSILILGAALTTSTAVIADKQADTKARINATNAMMDRYVVDTATTGVVFSHVTTIQHRCYWGIYRANGKPTLYYRWHSGKVTPDIAEVPEYC